MNERRQVLRTVPAVLLALGVGLAVTLWGGGSTALADGTVELEPNGPYTQTFDTLATTGSSTVLPLGWSLHETGSSAAADGSYRAFAPGSSAGDTYSFGATGSSERALGSLRSNNLIPLIGVKVTNNTGATIDALAIGYTGEQWRLGASNRGPDQLHFQFSTDATSLATGTWQDYDALDFSSPATTGSPAHWTAMQQPIVRPSALRSQG